MLPAVNIRNMQVSDKNLLGDKILAWMGEGTVLKSSEADRHTDEILETKKGLRASPMWRWVFSWIRCRGRHHYMMHFLGEVKEWECSRCGQVSKIPESLTQPSGAFMPGRRGRSRAVSSTAQDPAKVKDANHFNPSEKAV
jgi:hypothetical protein